jgi:hypothetical protein
MNAHVLFLLFVGTVQGFVSGPLLSLAFKLSELGLLAWKCDMKAPVRLQHLIMVTASVCFVIIAQGAVTVSYIHLATRSGARTWSAGGQVWLLGFFVGLLSFACLPMFFRKAKSK